MSIKTDIILPSCHINKNTDVEWWDKPINDPYNVLLFDNNLPWRLYTGDKFLLPVFSLLGSKNDIITSIQMIRDSCDNTYNISKFSLYDIMISAFDKQILLVFSLYLVQLPIDDTAKALPKLSDLVKSYLDPIDVINTKYDENKSNTVFYKKC